jgi:hypothetical protein
LEDERVERGDGNEVLEGCGELGWVGRVKLGEERDDLADERGRGLFGVGSHLEEPGAGGFECGEANEEGGLVSEGTDEDVYDPDNTDQTLLGSSCSRCRDSLLAISHCSPSSKAGLSAQILNTLSLTSALPSPAPATRLSFNPAQGIFSSKPNWEIPAMASQRRFRTVCSGSEARALRRREWIEARSVRERVP